MSTAYIIPVYCSTYFVMHPKYLNAKLYQRKDDIHSALVQSLLQVAPSDASLSLLAAKKTAVVKAPLRELTEQALLQQVIPTAALVNSKGDILYLHGHTGMYLEPEVGDLPGGIAIC